MGWFESTETPGVMLGDEAFDRAYELLHELARCYRGGVGRKPTLEELRALLQTELRVAGAELCEDADGKQVEVVFKTKKKPKEQPVEVGDVFAIRLPDGRHVFGRLMHRGSAQDIVIEVFRATRRSPAFHPEIAASGRLLHPMNMTSTRAINRWRWLVVGTTPGYASPADEIQGLSFVDRNDRNDGFCVRSFAGKQVAAVDEAEFNRRWDYGQAWYPSAEEVERLSVLALERASA